MYGHPDHHLSHLKKGPPARCRSSSGLGACLRHPARGFRLRLQDLDITGLARISRSTRMRWMSGQSNPQRGQNRGDSRSRGPTSSLRPLGGVVQRRPHFQPSASFRSLAHALFPAHHPFGLFMRRPSENAARVQPGRVPRPGGDPWVSQMLLSVPDEVLANDTRMEREQGRVHHPAWPAADSRRSRSKAALMRARCVNACGKLPRCCA